MTENPYSRTARAVREPPRGFRQTIRQLGPGMILVGSVVGSGELIMTTKLGALAGFVFLWFVLLSCFIKVVVQAELARHTVSSGQTFLGVFNSLPGPSSRRPAGLTLGWMATVVVASVLALTVYLHLDPDRRTWLTATASIGAVVLIAVAAARLLRPSARHPPKEDVDRPRINWFMWLWLASMLLLFVNSGAILGGAGQVLQMVVPGVFGEGGSRVWATIVAVLSAILLLSGTYASLEKVFVILVSTFTVLTVICTVLLQWTDFGISWSDVKEGLSFGMPSSMTAMVTLTALAMYAGTGVAFGEMQIYSYWCVEKGYARNVGEREPGQGWPRRARGWIRVMYTDVLLTMVVYTISTVCFYFLGAAVLHEKELNPDGAETLSTLSMMYTGSLGDWASTLFVVGAFFVLLTTVLAGAAGNSRLMADSLSVMGIIDLTDFKVRLRFIRVFVVVSLILYSIAYWLLEDPPTMLLVTSSIIAAVMYPILGLGALYLRYARVDPRIAPGRWTTAWLWFCSLSLTVISPGGILLALAIRNGWISIGN